MESDRKTYKGRQAGARRQRLQKLEAIEEKKVEMYTTSAGRAGFSINLATPVSLCVSHPQHGTRDTPQCVDPSLCLFLDHHHIKKTSKDEQK